LREISGSTPAEIGTAISASIGAMQMPSAKANVTICAEMYLTRGKSPLPFVCPMMAIDAALMPWASAMLMLTTGSLKVTALATYLPATLLMNSPSERGRSD